MSQKEPRNSLGDRQPPESGYDNRPKSKIKMIASLILFAFILGAAIASGVTLFLLKGNLLTFNRSTPALTPNPTPEPAPTPTPEPAPTPTPPSVELSPSPTENSNNPPPISSAPPEENNPDSTPPTKENKSNQLGDGSEAKQKNSELPGYFPAQGFTAPPSDLSRFQKDNLLIKEMVISGDTYINFVEGKILVRGKLYSPVFRLRGDTNEQRVGFELDGEQKALLLQFGLQDLSAGDTNLTYLVRLYADGTLVWADECKYGQERQILSVPLDVPGATSLVIEYSITESGGFPSYNLPPLYFTTAKLLYE